MGRSLRVLGRLEPGPSDQVLAYRLAYELLDGDSHRGGQGQSGRQLGHGFPFGRAIDDVVRQVGSIRQLVGVESTVTHESLEPNRDLPPKALVQNRDESRSEFRRLSAGLVFFSLSTWSHIHEGQCAKVGCVFQTGVRFLIDRDFEAGFVALAKAPHTSGRPFRKMVGPVAGNGSDHLRTE